MRVVALRCAAAVALLCAAAGCGDNGVDVLTPISTLVQSDLAGLDLMPSACTTANVALCEGFEADVLAQPWDAVEGMASVALDSGRAFRGLHSLRVHTNGQDGGVAAVLQGEVTEAAVLPNPLYVRFYVYVPSPLPSAGWRLAGALQQDYPNEGPALYVDGGALTFVGPAPALTPTQSATPLPADRWVCVEWLATLDQAGETQTFVDGSELGDLHLLGNMLPPGTDTDPLHRLSLGSAFFGDTAQQAAYDIWIDEIIVDSRRVGCDG